MKKFYKKPIGGNFKNCLEKKPIANISDGRKIGVKAMKKEDEKEIGKQLKCYVGYKSNYSNGYNYFAKYFMLRKKE